ncbi:MAG: hypothetical protein ACQES9_00415 [Myxococcota bacterium]
MFFQPNPKILSTLFCWFLFSLSLTNCDGSNPSDNSNFTFMDGDFADCEYDTLKFVVSGGDPVIVQINGLQVQTFYGANKLDEDSVEIVERRGVALKDILEVAQIDLPRATPVNCIARDNWDPLRTRLENDTSKLPTFGFLLDYGYIYAGNPGDKDPLYPEMEGKSLSIDYNLAGDEDVPEYLGGTLSSLGIFRFLMLEEYSPTKYGIIELDPQVN